MGAQFAIGADEGFYLTVAEDITVYEDYEAAVAEIQGKLDDDSEGFLAEVAIERAADEDVAVTLEQVAWQRIIRDLQPAGDASGDAAVADGEGATKSSADGTASDSGADSDANTDPGDGDAS